MKRINIKNSDTVFRGAKPLQAADLGAIKKFVDCGLNGFASNIIEDVEKKAPKMIADIEGEKYVKDFTFFQKMKSAIISVPMDILDFFAKKFPKSKLANSSLIANYRAKSALENEINAFQGMKDNALKFMKQTMEKDAPYPQGECSEYCHSICDPVSEKFIELLNNKMADNVAMYDTKKERFVTRLVSGGTAALFLGNDFYNKAIQKGATEEQAKKEQKLKQGQEIRENIIEALVQFSVFACFSRAVNSSVWAPAIIGAAIGLVSRIASRLWSHMPIRRIKAPAKRKVKAPSINEYAQGSKDTTLQVKKQEKPKKKPILSVKNILLACGISVAGGYAMRFLKGKLPAPKFIADLKERLNKLFEEDIIVEKSDLLKLNDILEKGNEEGLFNYVDKIINSSNPASSKIKLDSQDKTVKLFGKINVKTKEIYNLITAPLRFVKELVSYPYKIVSKLETAIKSKMTGVQPNKKTDFKQQCKNIKNLYAKFVEFSQKYPNDDEKLASEFSQYIQKMRLLSNNTTTSSKGDVSKIAVLAQTLGTLTGMYFNMNDEYNSSIRSGGTISEAQKDARLRGINKFFRMTVQVIISGSLNALFAKQYNNSIPKAGLIVLASTVLTDIASRVLTGMPSKKMTKEELEQYQKEHKQGIMSHYYKFIDKLAS